MSALFNHAIRYEWMSQGKNPVTLVRQSAKRLRIPDVLEIDEIQVLFAVLSPRDRAVVMLDAVTGLRRSELLGLKWSDIDFEGLEINVTRSVFRQVVGACKTEASKRPLPLDPWIAAELFTWRRQSEFPRRRTGSLPAVPCRGRSHGGPTPFSETTFSRPPNAWESRSGLASTHFGTPIPRYSRPTERT
jgi:integrase